MLMLPDYRVRQRDFLLEISRALTAQLDLSEVLRQILDASVVMLAGQVGIIALREPDGLFYVRATRGLDSEHISTINQYLHEIFANSENRTNADAFNTKLREMSNAIDRRLRQSVALPMTFADEFLGMMIVFRNYRSNATANDIQILQSFADQAAIAVHNAQLYEKINHERKRLEAILEHSGDGVMILDSTLTILRFNRTLERMTGWIASDALGQHQNDVIVWDKLEQGDLPSALDEGWPFQNKDNEPASLYVEGDLLRLDGLTLSVGITYAPMITDDGKLESIIANVRDITNFRQEQEMQNTFISIISHELKTPVAIIKGYAATLSRPDANWEPAIIRENLGVIEDEADRLNGLIQNLLTASKLQAQREMSLELDEIWLNELTERSVERFRTQTNKHELLLDMPHDFPVILADSTRLLQVIDNLIGNAIKYSPDGGNIEVSGHYNDGSVTIEVSDHGVGLSKEDQERVFDRFYRVDGKLSSKTQGTGLGLYLAKAIIQAHGGTIAVDSHPGQGSTFYFTLPR